MNFTQQTTLHNITFGSGTESPIPDERVKYLSKNYNLIGKKVLEPGCLEGICTLSLFELGAIVRPFDIRQENVDKTNARLQAYYYEPVAFKADCNYLYYENEIEDIIFHAGLLYHLMNPVENLYQCSLASPILFLDTHYATEGDQFCNANLSDELTRYRCIFGQSKQSIKLHGKWYAEGGMKDVYSGTENKSFWPTEQSLIEMLNIFYKDVKILYDHEGHKRIFILAKN